MTYRINNRDKLTTNAPRRAALDIAEAGLAAIDTANVMERVLEGDGDRLTLAGEAYDLSRVNDLYVVGIGKCAAEAGKVLEKKLGGMITDGAVLGVGDHSTDFSALTYFEGTHPMPSERNVEASRTILELLGNTGENDLVIFVISGGGSTLLCLPEEGDTCFTEETVLDTLFQEGAPIQKINTIRKHMSRARGGRLAKEAYPARVVSLIFSDIPGGDIEYVASGPTIRDTSTVEDADRILADYDILRTCKFDHCGLMETPKDEIYFEQVRNICVVSNEDALAAMKEQAHAYSIPACICTSCLEGEARTVGRTVLDELRSDAETGIRLYGGETTVTITGDGVGGRNQECALSALTDIRDNELVLTIASDGRDNTDYAGAIADSITYAHAKQLGLDPEDYLARNDSYHFFEQTGDAVITGRTGSNVSDLLIAICTDMLQ